jgi:hypothetical protein
MVQGIIQGTIKNDELPGAPLEDKADIQHLIDDLFGEISKTTRTKVQKDILLGSLRDGRLRVIFPLQVKFYAEEGKIVAEAIEISEFGFGDSWSEALADLQRAIAELFFTLEKEKKRLGVDLKRVQKILQEKIVKR